MTCQRPCDPAATSLWRPVEPNLSKLLATATRSAWSISLPDREAPAGLPSSILAYRLASGRPRTVVLALATVRLPGGHMLKRVLRRPAPLACRHHRLATVAVS